MQKWFVIVWKIILFHYHFGTKTMPSTLRTERGREMFLIPIAIVFFSFTSSILPHELTAETANLLTCPIKNLSDLNYLRSFSARGRPLDIFQEKIENRQTFVQLVTDEETARILLSKAGCFEEKGRAGINRLFSLPSKSAVPVYGNRFHDDYRSYQNIIDQLNAYASSHPHLVKSVKSIGKSHEGRDLFAIHITAASKSSTKPLIWIMAGQHAREWIAPASTMFFIHLLLNSNETNLLHKYEFAVVPLANPDGYEYSRNTNRIWRKNRRIPYGVDLNRNWDHRWCEIGTNPRVL